jgi:DNA gyrase/topoisomerase IV subunit A
MASLPEANPTASSTPQPTVANRILIVDDETSSRDLCQAFLESDGYDVETCDRAMKAVALLELKKFDLVLTDLSLPEMSGVELIKKGEDVAFLTMSENGLGKKTAVKEYKVQNRGGSGIKTAKVTPKTGKLIIGKVVAGEGELIAISKKGQVIKVDLATIPSLGRQTQGVTIMKLRPGDSIASLTCL